MRIIGAQNLIHPVLLVIVLCVCDKRFIQDAKFFDHIYRHLYDEDRFLIIFGIGQTCLR